MPLNTMSMRREGAFFRARRAGAFPWAFAGLRALADPRAGFAGLRGDFAAGARLRFVGVFEPLPDCFRARFRFAIRSPA